MSPKDNPYLAECFDNFPALIAIFLQKGIISGTICSIISSISCPTRLFLANIETNSHKFTEEIAL